MKNMELLAPAGSMETLRAVCAAGADAVYVGGGQFGARAYAKNFTQEELLQAIDEVHLQGKKLHLTVNTLLKNEELEEQLYDYLLPYYEQGLDAVIVQDVGVFDFIKKQFPGMELHASTQMSIANAEGARFFAQAGADRVVLARELSLQEIRRIHENVDVPLECFVHGAICYCYSGQCLFSSMLGGRSGNRGRCAQPCRLPYRVQQENTSLDTGKAKELYPLSPKDLCAIDLLPELADAGVCSLKVEGRMKQSNYAAGVTAIYRRYLDMLSQDADNYAVAESDRRQLMDLGNRSGFTAGYLRGEKGRSMISLYSPKHTSVRTAEGEAKQWKQVQRPVRGVCECRIGAPVVLSVTDLVSGQTVQTKTGEIQAAQKAPALPADVERVLRQTGDSACVFEQLEIRMDDNCFIPKQFLKSVRRDAIEALEQMLKSQWRRQAPSDQVEDIRGVDSLESTERAMQTQALVTVCDTWEQFAVCARKDYVGTVVMQIQAFDWSCFEARVHEAAQLCRQTDKQFLLAMPSVLREHSIDFLEKNWDCIRIMQENNLIDGFLAKTYDTLGFLQRMGVPAEHVWLDSPLYTFSDRACAFFREKGYRIRTLPLELHAGELRRQPQAGSCLIIYGHTPFMVSSQCVNRTMYGCDQTDKTLFLGDRYGRRLPVKNYCSVCCNVIYNAIPTVLYEPAAFDEVKRIAPELLRMDFTVENEAVTRAVLAGYEQYVLGRTPEVAAFQGEATRGHFKRGVE